jgi:hypothetical protein
MNPVIVPCTISRACLCYRVHLISCFEICATMFHSLFLSFGDLKRIDTQRNWVIHTQDKTFHYLCLLLLDHRPPVMLCRWRSHWKRTLKIMSGTRKTPWPNWFTSRTSHPSLDTRSKSLLTGASHAYLKDHRQLHGKAQVYLCGCTFFFQNFWNFKISFSNFKNKEILWARAPIAFYGESKDYMFIWAFYSLIHSNA